MDDRACAWCGASLEGKNSRANFCCRNCRKTAARDAARIKEKKCAWCGNVFAIEDARSWKKSVCSHDCWKAIDRIKHAKKSGHQLSIYGPLRPKKCALCGIEYLSFGTMGKFCSPACKGRFAHMQNPEPIRASCRASYRNSLAKLHMQEALQAIPALMAMIEDAMKETTK